MTRRILAGFVLLAMTAALALAQVPARRTFPPREKTGLKAAVTVIDLRNVAGEKKPPKRAADPLFSLRKMSGSKPNSAVSTLAPAQLGEALQGAGISVVPSNVYARFTPGQSNAQGKGYMYLLGPDVVYPDHVQFTPSGEQAFPRMFNGPMVVLREPGTYVFDFLVEFPDAPVGTYYSCIVLVGQNDLQTKAVVKTDGPQHILVVWTLDQDGLALPDDRRSVGIYCYLSRSGGPDVPWMFYLADVTKI
jgi:hypothetical protein